MITRQSVVSPDGKSNVVLQKQDSPVLQKIVAASNDSVDFLGALQVFIHQARDIHNICIYQKQDVYAKLCLTSDPENTVSTKIINGGGRNPIFNENLSLNIRTADSSLKCEIWMLSRVRNYLEDQLLGFALVPISEILLHDGRLDKDFSLSSTDLFHSPAGFVQLTVLYVGGLPEVIPISPPLVMQGIEMTNTGSILDGIDFPDPQVVNETNKMVEQYFALDSQVISEIEDPTLAGDKSTPQKPDSPSSSVSTNGTVSISNSASVASSEAFKVGKDEHVSSPNEKIPDNDSTDDSFMKPVASVNYEPEPKVVQKEIVDLYMKSMQQFTESLAKMKLPAAEFESSPKSTEGSSGSGQKTPESKNPSSRVFYGSRAFF